MIIRRPRALLAFGLAVGALLILGVGVIRYDGFAGLYLRVRAEFSGTGGEALVPLPLATAVDPASPDPALAAAVSPTPSPSATAPRFTPTPAATAGPTRTPRPSDTPSPTPAPLYAPTKASVELTGLRHEWQTWNNCGPDTLAMNLSYYGLALTQADVAAVVHPDMDDKHTGIAQLAAFARGQGFEALMRVNGNADILRLLLSNGLPVMMPTWHVDAKGTGMGHYRLLTGYDDALSEWILYDSLESRGISKDQPYPGIRLPYAQFDEWWQVMNRSYLVVYPPEQAPLVAAILGAQMDDAVMWSTSLDAARRQVAVRPDDAFAWFTLGTNLVGNGLPEDAAAAYDQARRIGLPFRMMWYQFGAFQAYYESGHFEEVVALADATLATTEMIEEVHYWRGRALATLGDVEGARRALKTALAQRADFPEAAAALEALDN